MFTLSDCFFRLRCQKALKLLSAFRQGSGGQRRGFYGADKMFYLLGNFGDSEAYLFAGF
jgi:hypothetical protein